MVHWSNNILAETTGKRATLMLMPVEKMVLAGCLVFQVSAMTVRDIPGSADNPGDSALAGTINLCDETFSQVKIKKTYSPVSHDSIKTALYTSLSQLDRISPDRNSARLLLLKGLVWHCLYRLNVDTAFFMADRLAASVMKSYPEIPEAAWLKGVNLIRAARIKEGFAILDSLRTGGLIQNQDFFLDYAKLSARCFLPLNRTLSDSVIFFLSSTDKSKHDNLREEERTPFSETWRVCARSSQKLKNSEFTFSGLYALSQPLSLLPSLSPPSSASRLKMDIDERIINRFGPIPTRLVYDPEASKFPMEVKIIADCSKPGVSLADYMGSIVRDRFDMIKETNELPKLKAISLRCYNRSVFRNVPGEFCAFVTFDLKLPANASGGFHESKTKPSGKDDAVIVRYLIAMKTSDAVEEKAEAIFKELVCQFERMTNLN